MSAAPDVAPLRRIAVVNRGEPAMRLVHAVRDLNEERGLGLRTIALYTDPDRTALFVREADEAVCLGPAVVRGDDGGRHSAYVDLDILARALQESRADAAWVGWGFSAESADFAEWCERHGVLFVGPCANAMRTVGDKIAAKRLAETLGIAVAPWTEGPVPDAEAAEQQARRLGFPLLVKAAAGGGGRGIRVVQHPGELAEAFLGAEVEAQLAFGDPTLFLEHLLPVARHVEVQVVGDGLGTTWALGVRDCSLQRRHQKVVEESASTALDEAGECALREQAVRLCNAVRYRGAGTVEFLLDPESGDTCFLELNPRLQVEHPVTEMATGVDIVRLQLDLAMGGRLTGAPPPARGHAVEARLCAEDAANGFAPAPGVIETLRLPTGPGVRVDTGVAEGDAVAAEFDSMIAKIIAWGEDRPAALARLRRALAETTVLLRGGATNRAFLLELLRHPVVEEGRYDTTWLDRAGLAGPSQRHADIALPAAAIAVDEAEHEVERTQFYSWAARGRPQVRTEVGRGVELRHNGRHYQLRVHRVGAEQWRLRLDGADVEVELQHVGREQSRIRLHGESHRLACTPQSGGFLVEVDGVAHRFWRDDGGLVRAPAAAVVVGLRVATGDRVAAGDVVAVLEAMKMETPLRAPFAGTVARILTTPNVQVDPGTPLLQLDPGGHDDDVSPRAERISIARDDEHRTAAADDDGPTPCCHRALDLLRRLMLGYEIDSTAASAALADHQAGCLLARGDDPQLRREEDEVLAAFANISALARRRSDDDRDSVGHDGVQERLFAYLRSPDAETPAPAFADTLRRALAHYGVTSLERTPELEECLYRLVTAHHRAETQVPVALSLLDRRLAQVSAVPEQADEDLRRLLDRILVATRGRHPAVAELAREVRHRAFDRPLMERARSAVYEDAERHLAALETAGDDDEAYQGHVAALVQCPQPLHSLLTGRMAQATPSMRATMLEVMTRRYYRTGRLGAVRPRVVDGHLLAEARYQGRRGHVRVLTTYTGLAELSIALAAVRRAAATIEASEVAVDVYAWRADGAQPDAEELQSQVQAALDAAQLPPAVHRLVVMVAAPGRGLGMSSSRHLTYRRRGGRYVEDAVYRDLHPQMGERLQLWRLRNFRIRRLPSVEDVYLFHGVARGNAKDERLFAMVEVRDLTAERDAAGHAVRLPHLERMLLESLAGIRAEQSRRRPQERLQGNRVLLHVWPTFDIDLGDVEAIARRLGPETEGLGLEKIVVGLRLPDAAGVPRDSVLQLSNPLGTGVVMMRYDTPTNRPIAPLSDYRQKVVAMRRRGLVYPYEIVEMLASESGGGAEIPPGEFVEHDLDGDTLVPVQRAPGQNSAGLVVGVVRSFTLTYPEGMARVVLLGDPSRALGALAEPECRRICAALDLAERMQVPLEWFTLSSGAKISMDSGTENMDWIARVLRRIIEFTQAGGEINLVVNGINVGAQPYWNAEATMLMHTRGILVMTPDGAMVLTGKQALDYSGSVSAEDNFGIGGYERIMGPNGQAQYWAPDLASACRLLFRHYAHTYRAPGERFPRRAATDDPCDRDVCDSPHPRLDGGDFSRVGDVFSDQRNPGRKKPFDIRAVMAAVADQDHPTLERWPDMRDAQIAVVWDAHLGGQPVCLLGIESQPLSRTRFIPADGPDHWTPGTLFPQSSKKVARAVNSAGGNRPLVVLANLSGFDGSPESMRRLQLEFGAEIGRAVVNFRGPIVFCVVSRYHGGAFVVFSAALNESMEVAALEGSYASVIGGAPAAAVVFARDVEARTRADQRVVELAARVDAAEGARKAELRRAMAALLEQVRSEKLGEVAQEFDAVHTVQRAQRVGSVHRIIPASALRPYLIEAVQRGIARELQRCGSAG